MDFSTWYAAGVFGATALCILICTFSRFARTFYLVGKCVFLKYLKHSETLKFFGNSFHITRLELFVILFILIGNIVAITIGVSDRPTFAKRTGVVSIINIVPLFLGARMSLIVSSCNLSLTSYARIHRWLGAAAIVESVLHAATSLSIQKPGFSKREEVAGFLVSHSQSNQESSNLYGRLRRSSSQFHYLDFFFDEPTKHFQAYISYPAQDYL